MSLEERERYAVAMKHRWDYQNTIDFAEQKGREEGHEAQQIETARRMLEDKMPIDVVVKYSGLTEEQVKQLGV